MFAKVTYLGYHCLGGDLEIDGVKIMQCEWKLLRKPIVFAFGQSCQGSSPTFSPTFIAEENRKMVFFLANESGIAKYHIWSFSDKAVEKLRSYEYGFN